MRFSSPALTVSLLAISVREGGRILAAGGSSTSR